MNNKILSIFLMMLIKNLLVRNDINDIKERISTSLKTIVPIISQIFSDIDEQNVSKHSLHQIEIEKIKQLNAIKKEIEKIDINQVSKVILDCFNKKENKK